MIDIIAAVNDDAVLAANLRRSPALTEPGVTLHVQRGYPSAALAFKAAMQRSRVAILVFVHQDVYLPAGWTEQLLDNIARVERTDPNWAVMGVYGVTRDGVQVGQVWSTGLDRLFGARFEAPVGVESIDEVVIVLRRASGVEFDVALPGYHLYATDLVQTARSRNLGCYAICAPVVHNSRPCRYLGRDYFVAYRFMARKWRRRLPIDNNVANIVEPGPRYLKLRVQHWLSALRHGFGAQRAEASSRDCVVLARQLGFE